MTLVNKHGGAMFFGSEAISDGTQPAVRRTKVVKNLVRINGRHLCLSSLLSE